ncbi:hypothetical protein [Roseiconus lacunae]|uniref:Alpha-glutamyl/putrescinyl thymine pyrophosphorylase clade 3 domain-containing protein n=1 Tax=Roseiconus lacunae TaxID=2605694 RepID=A0ABT7PNW3_9BACT|nr:hypothetical protein [Roseiconus lacunae]MDM4018189.1 hypothetical protein [Roseiconus lacunae]
MLEWAAQRHEVFSKRWKVMMQREGDILALINQAAKSGDTDEAVWRCFLAAHFGRTSSQDAHRIASSAMFLCAFGDSPRWTWECISSDPKGLQTWLSKNRSDLASLQFGNHRKFESPKPKLMWEVIKSFVDLAHEFEGPELLIDLEQDEKGDPFDILYQRLRPLKRFGRTGRFDFLVLLSDLGLINAEPMKCYLQGATGPKDGAKLLWGDWTTGELDQAAAELAAGLAVSPHVMEDALCCWQK